MCKYCEPNNEIWIDGENGDACLTKDAEIVVFPKTDFPVNAVHLKIKFCPMCGRKYEEDEE